MLSAIMKGFMFCMPVAVLCCNSKNERPGKNMLPIKRAW